MIHILMSRGILGHPSMIEAIKPCLAGRQKVVIVALSYFDKHLGDPKSYQDYYAPGSEYHQKMIDSFAPYGINEKSITWILDYKESASTAQKKINEADIIYLPGGSPVELMARIKAFDIKAAIEAHQGVLIGSSAGAMVQFARYHISPDRDFHRFSYEEGLDLLKGFAIEVHYRRRKKQKKALRKVRREQGMPIYSIPDDGAIIIKDGDITLIHSARQRYTSKGVVR